MGKNRVYVYNEIERERKGKRVIKKRRKGTQRVVRRGREKRNRGRGGGR